MFSNRIKHNGVSFDLIFLFFIISHNLPVSRTRDVSVVHGTKPILTRFQSAVSETYALKKPHRLIGKPYRVSYENPMDEPLRTSALLCLRQLKRFSQFSPACVRVEAKKRKKTDVCHMVRSVVKRSQSDRWKS